MPSKAELDFHGVKPYMRVSRNPLTPSLQVANIRFPVSLKPGKRSIQLVSYRHSIADWTFKPRMADAKAYAAQEYDEPGTTRQSL